MRKVLFIAICFIAFNAGAQNVGIGTPTPIQKLDVKGNQHISDSLAIGVSSPHAPLHFANITGKKIILYEDANNSNQYYGIAVDPSALRFQTNNNFVFLDGSSPTTSNELFRITTNGFVGISNTNPKSPLHFANNFLYKKLALYDTSNNSNLFYGFGVTNNLLNYQSQGDHAFFTGTSSASSAELMRITSTGNVGIGVSDPHAQIHLANSDGRKIILYEDGNNDNDYYGMAINPGTFRFQAGGDYAFFASRSSTASAELMRITYSGNVGIGTSSPTSLLQLANTINNKKLVLFDSLGDQNQFYGFGTFPGLLTYQSQNDHAFYSGTSSSSSTELVRFSSNGNVGIGVPDPHAQIHLANTTGRKIVLYENSNSDNDYFGIAIDPGTLRFQSNGNFIFYRGTSPTASSEQFRIESNGNIGVGTPSPLTKFSNTDLNIIASDGVGVGPGSITWHTNDGGYVQGLYNASTEINANGLAVKIAGTNPANRLLDLSTFGTSIENGTAVMVVQGDGKVGIGDNAPSEKLVVNGAVKIDNGGYTTIINNATTPVPAGGGGTMVFVNGNFYGWTGTQWKQLNN